jgi:hypothetical protein
MVHFSKICLGVDSEKELIDIFENDRIIGLEDNLITDSVHTKFGGVPTNT